MIPLTPSSRLPHAPGAAILRSRFDASVESTTAERNPNVETIVTAMRCSSLFGRMSDADCDALARRGEMITHPADHLIYEEGEPETALFLVVHGRVELSCEWAGSERSVERICRDGDTFGELSAMDSLPRRERARAIEFTTLFKLEQPQLREHLRQSPSAIEPIIAEMARRLREIDRWLPSFTRHRG